ncbi:MAG: hypothetical protein ACI8XO_000647 [Verrucomicrobiales bacterium]|jgi:hypothetical protein
MTAKQILGKLQPPVVLYGRWEAMLMRLFFAVLVWFNLPAFGKFPEQRTPVGLAADFGFDFTFVNDPATMSVLKAWLLPLLVVYVIGYVRWLPLCYMLVLSLAVGTLKNSQGGEISHRFQIITMILVVQCGWHLLCAARWLAGQFFDKHYRFHHAWNVDRMEVFVSQSAIAAIYLTTAITKMIRSGGEWMWQVRHVGVDLQKTWGQDYYNTLSQEAPGWAVWIKDTVTTHPWVAVVIFGPGLLAEFAAMLGLYGRLKAFLIGSALVFLHVGAITVMKLEFEQNIYCLMIFFVNVPFLMLVAARRVLELSGGKTRLAKAN